MASRDDLRYTADGRRDTASRLDKKPNEQGIQTTMLEENAIATHRVAEAVEELTEAVKALGDD